MCPWHAMRPQALRPHFRGLLREQLLQHKCEVSVRRGSAHGLPRAFVCQLRAPQADAQGMPLLLRLDRYLDPAGGAAVFAIAGIAAGTVEHPAIIAPR